MTFLGDAGLGTLAGGAWGICLLAARQCFFWFRRNPVKPFALIAQGLDYIAPRPPRGLGEFSLADERAAGLVFEVIGDRHVLWPGYWEWEEIETFEAPTIKRKWMVKPPDGASNRLLVDPQTTSYLEARDNWSHPWPTVTPVLEQPPIPESLPATPLSTSSSSAPGQAVKNHQILVLEARAKEHQDHCDALRVKIMEVVTKLNHYMATTRKVDQAVVEEARVRADQYNSSLMLYLKELDITLEQLARFGEEDKADGLLRQAGVLQENMKKSRLLVPPFNKIRNDPTPHHCVYTDSPYCNICGEHDIELEPDWSDYG